MANENMIKFLRGNVANLPQTATSGALYFTKDEGIYLGMEDGSYHRYGDFITVANVKALPASGAHATCMYYCTEENILARYDAEKGWIQINKQPTAEEMKTLLGLGDLAYLDEVAEGDLNAELAAKINAASGAQHTHANKNVLDGITAEKVTAWDASEQNAKDYADGLDEAMNARVEALEAIDHSHTFLESELNKIVDGDVAKWNTAASKAHEHSFNETELNKIVEGDVAKWNGVAADHLTSADKTALEDAIKEAKKAGTDANTNIEAYKVTNDARVLAVEEDVAEITDGTNGILAQAKSYSDGKLATARTEISAEIDADVKVVADDLAGYKTTNDAAVAAKVAKADYEADKATFATKTELGNVDAKFADYVTSASYATDKAGIEKAIEDEAKARSDADAGFETRIAALEGNFGDGEGTVESQIAAAVAAEAEARAEAVKGVQDGVDAVAGRMTTAEGKITALEGASATHALKTEVEAVDAKFANYKTAEAQKAIDDEQDRRLGVIEGDYLKAADIADFETKDNVKKVADDLAAYVESNDAALAVVDGKFANYRTSADQDVIDNGHKERIEALEAKFTGDDSVADQIAAAVNAEKERAEEIEEALATDVGDLMSDFEEYVETNDARVKAIEDNYLKDTDKKDLQDQITANANAITAITDGIDPDKIDGLTDLVNWADEHAPEVASIKEDIETNAQAIADEKTRAEAKEGELATAIETAKTEASNQDAVVLAEAQKYADDKAAELANGVRSSLQDDIDANRGAIEKLNGEDTVDGSVAKSIKDAIAAENLGQYAKTADLGDLAALDAITHEKVTDFDTAVAAVKVAEATKATQDGNGKVIADTYAEKATTLAGYGIGDAYTKTETYTQAEVDALIAAAHTWGEF